MEQFSSPVDPTKEEIAIIELRQKISDVILDNGKFDDDLYLLQWLKAQKLNPNKAEDMIRESIKWRKENNIHSDLEKEFSPEFLKDFQVPFSTSKEGIPVAYFHLGKMDMKAGITLCGKTRWYQFTGMLFSKMEDLMVASNKAQNRNKPGRLTSDSISGIIGLGDTEGFSALQIVDPTVTIVMVGVIRNLSTYFPAIFSNLIYYNMNTFSTTLYNACKPFLNWPNLNLEIYGTDEKIWRETVLKFMDLEVFNELEKHWE
ncbi:unnamed protein product [Allacma fusca]|uniref:CRAL-TRIO domain-containing protein n=1 Tax=Allacma fusca TaxID=39272 RepID=A0A8J2P0J1_9HEXA|nr:unnamed protein product [Allacma fusca]